MGYSLGSLSESHSSIRGVFEVVSGVVVSSTICWNTGQLSCATRKLLI